jgi:type IV secretory pathway TrbD component
MNNQRPAAPAASLPATKPADSIVALPDKSVTWQRTYAPTRSPAPAISAPATSWAHSSANGYQVGNIVHQSLQRPKLLRGGEWQLSMINNLLAAGFGILTLMTWNWRFLLGALFFGWPVQWLIRMLGRDDPLYWQIYLRTRKRPLIREPHGDPRDHQAAPPRILPRLRKFAV